MSLAHFSVRRRVTVLMLFTAIVVIGLFSFVRLPLDLFPDIEPPVLSVITVYAGASAEDVEEKVTKILENQLSIITDLDEISSTSREGVSLVQLKMNWGANLDEASNNVRDQLDFALSQMPDDVERPMLFRFNLSQFPVLILSVEAAQGDIQQWGQYIEDHVCNQLQRVPGVAAVTMFNRREDQLLIEVDRQRLEGFRLSLAQLAQAIQAENLSLPAGDLDISRNTYVVRVPAELRTVADAENIVVGQNEGTPIYLKQVATVRLGLKDTQNIALLDNKTVLVMMLQRESGTNTVDVAKQAIAKIAELNETLPAGLHVSVITDLSEFIVQMVKTLTESIYWGGVLVIAVVFFFLRRVRTSLIVGLSIPTSLIGVFAGLHACGFTLNMISLASLAIAVGMVVDTTIVAIDNIMRRLDLGDEPEEAAARGVAEVGNALVASTTTTIAVFAPVLFVGGMIGVFFKELAFVIIVSIGSSLLVSLMLVPALSAYLIRRRAARQGLLYRASERFLAGIEYGYGKMLGWALRHRWGVIVGNLLVFIVSLGLLAVVGIDFMPQMDGGEVRIVAELPTGTRVERTFEVAGEIREILERRIPERRWLYMQAGASDSGFAAAFGAREGSNVAQVSINVGKIETRTRSTFDMIDAIRPEIEAIPGIVSIEMAGFNELASVGSGGQKPLTVEVFGDNLAEVRRSVKIVRELVKRVPGAVEVTTDLIEDRPELEIQIDRDKASRLGVLVASVADAVRTANYGNVISRFRGGDRDIDIFLRLRAEDRRTVADLENLTVPAVTGAPIKLANFATIREAKTPVEIRRMDQTRSVRVMAQVSGRALGDVGHDVEQAITRAFREGRLPSSISTRFAGDVQEQRNMIEDLSMAMILAIMLVFMVMAAQFESFLDPLVVMFSVPFGVTGVFLALFLTDTTLNVNAFIGMVMLVGIVVNNAIVLVDYINLQREEGYDLVTAVKRGGERRLRPVLMTALTTIGGMLPMIFMKGEGSEEWRSLGIAVAGGLAFSTLITLVLIPTIYAMTDRFRRVKRRYEDELYDHQDITELARLKAEEEARARGAAEQPVSG